MWRCFLMRQIIYLKHCLITDKRLTTHNNQLNHGISDRMLSLITKRI
jgi:hypothetical protein